MQYSEFRARRNKKENEKPAMEFSNPYKITCKEQYLEMMEAIYDYRGEPVNFEFSKEDFELFEKAYKHLEDYLTMAGVDDGWDQSTVEEIVDRMNSVGWRWCNQVVTKKMFMDTIRRCFETCMESKNPSYHCETGGVHVHTEVAGHVVKLSFGSFDEFATPKGLSGEVDE